MYNASKTLGRMLHSVCGQSYDKWKVILIDDVSSEEHKKVEEEIVLQFQCLMNGTYSEQIEVVWNAEKRWEVANVLKGISMCKDDDIICRIDADDWLTDLDALQYINAIYNHTKCEAAWSAHRWGYTDKNISGPLLPEIDVYNQPWVSSHLKTFRKHVINGVKDENFRGEDGEYITRAGDQAIYLPVLHNTTNCGFIPRVFYHYTIEDIPETYQTPDAYFQRDEAEFLRKRGYVE